MGPFIFVIVVAVIIIMICIPISINNAKKAKEKAKETARREQEEQRIRGLEQKFRNNEFVKEVIKELSEDCVKYFEECNSNQYRSRFTYKEEIYFIWTSPKRIQICNPFSIGKTNTSNLGYRKLTLEEIQIISKLVAAEVFKNVKKHFSGRSLAQDYDAQIKFIDVNGYHDYDDKDLIHMTEPTPGGRAWYRSEYGSFRIGYLAKNGVRTEYKEF